MASILAYASNLKDALVGPGPSDQDRVQELWYSFDSHREEVVQALEAAGEVDKDFGEACLRSGLEQTLEELMQGIAAQSFELLDAAIEEDVFRKLAELAHENKPVGLRCLVLGGLCALFEAADLETKAELFGHARLRQPLLRTLRAAATFGSGVSSSPLRRADGPAARRRRAVRLQLERNLMKNRLRLARSVWQVVATHPALLDGLGPSQALALQSLVEPAVASAGHTGSGEGEEARLALLDAASCADPRVDASLLGLGAANVLAGSCAALLGELPTAPSTWAAVRAAPPLPSATPSAHAAVDPVVQRAGDASAEASESQLRARADLLGRLEQLAGQLQYLQSLVAVSSSSPAGGGQAEGGGFGWRLAKAFEDQVCRRVLVESLLPEATSDPARALLCTSLTALLLALESGPPDCPVRRALCLAVLGPAGAQTTPSAAEDPGGVLAWVSSSALSAAASAAAIPLIAAASAGLRGRPDLADDRAPLQRFLADTLGSRTGQLLRGQDPGYGDFVAAARPAAVALGLAAPLPPVQAQEQEMRAAAVRAGVVLRRQLAGLLEAPVEVGLAVTGAVSAALRGETHAGTLRALLLGGSDGGAGDGDGGAAAPGQAAAAGPLPVLLPLLLGELRRRAAAMPDFAEALRLARRQAGVVEHVAVDSRWASAEAELLQEAAPTSPAATTPAQDLALAPAPVGAVLLLEFVKELVAFAEALQETVAQAEAC